MFRKATVTAATLIALASVLAGCSTITYTGTAVVKEHRQSGKNCLADLVLANGEQGEFHMGLRSTCESLTDGATVTMENGYYKK